MTMIDNLKNTAYISQTSTDVHWRVALPANYNCAILKIFNHFDAKN